MRQKREYILTCREPFPRSPQRRIFSESLQRRTQINIRTNNKFLPQ